MPNVVRLVYRPFSSIIDSIIFYSVFHTISILITYITKNRKLKAMPLLKKGFEDHRLEAKTDSAEYTAIFKRLTDAYCKAKIDQENIAEPYKVGILWQRTIDNYCGDLITALRDGDTAKLQAVLENLHRERSSAGLQGGSDYFNMKRRLIYKYLYLNTWYKFYNLCKEIEGGCPMVTYPMVGNPIGLYHDGQVISTDAFRFHYSATEVISLLEDMKSPVVCEIGSGLGGHAYAVLSNARHAVTYILLDIPEVLLQASYFLMAALPEKRFLLYGEEPLDSNKINQYDVILMPHFMLPQLGDKTVDLFFNQSSFPEMHSETVKEYLLQIERICRRYFMHVNHSTNAVWYEEGRKAVNVPGTQIIPDPKQFKKIYQHP